MMGVNTALEGYLAKLPLGPSGLPAGWRMWKDGQGRVQGQFFHCSLTSVFQGVHAIVSRDGSWYDAGIVAYEARVRTYAEGVEALNPWKMFALAADNDTLVSLDRLCRMVHTVNYHQQGESLPPLYLNVHGRLLAAVADDHGRAFRRAVEALQLAPEQFVIQLPVSANENLALLSHVVENYRRNGFRVAANAADGVQAGALLAQVRPDLLKLDMQHSWVPRILAGLQDVATQADIALVAERVRRPESLVQIWQAGIGLAQGNLLDAPAFALDPETQRSFEAPQGTGTAAPLPVRQQPQRC